MSQFINDAREFLSSVLSFPASVFTDAVGEAVAPLVRTALLGLGVVVVGVVLYQLV